MAKRGRRKKTTKKTSRGGGTRRGRPSALAGASMSEIKAELGRRVGDLERRREELNSELAQIDSDIAELQSAFGGGAPKAAAGGRRTQVTVAARRSAGTTRGGARGGARGRRRARNQQSLADALKDVLTGQTLSVTEMADAVQKAGYKTKSAGNFRTIVNQTLIRDPKTFKRVGRGQYTAR